jgi:hypothetical protein
MGKNLRDLNSFLIRHRSRPIWSSEGAPMLGDSLTAEKRLLASVPEIPAAFCKSALVHLAVVSRRLDAAREIIIAIQDLHTRRVRTQGPP